MMSALPLASVRLTVSKLLIPFPNHILDGAVCKNFVYFHIFCLFCFFFNHDFFKYSDLPIS